MNWNWIIAIELAVLIFLTWRNSQLLGAISHNIHLLDTDGDDDDE